MTRAEGWGATAMGAKGYNPRRWQGSIQPGLVPNPGSRGVRRLERCEHNSRES